MSFCIDFSSAAACVGAECTRIQSGLAETIFCAWASAEVAVTSISWSATIVPPAFLTRSVISWPTSMPDEAVRRKIATFGCALPVRLAM